MVKMADQQLAKTLYQLVDQASSIELDQILTKFATYLVSIGALQRWPVIAAAYRQYWQKQQGIVEAEVYSVRPLTKQQLKTLADELAILIAAKKVVIIEKIDPKILGGIIVRLPDRLLDASYQRQVYNLQAKLLY